LSEIRTKYTRVALLRGDLLGCSYFLAYSAWDPRSPTPPCKNNAIDVIVGFCVVLHPLLLHLQYCYAVWLSQKGEIPCPLHTDYIITTNGTNTAAFFIIWVILFSRHINDYISTFQVMTSSGAMVRSSHSQKHSHIGNSL